MSKYAFILGQASRLAATELLNVLNQPKNYLWQDNLLITETELAPESLLKQLGGTIKIAKIIASYQNLADFKTTDWCQYLETQKLSGKFTFGFSVYHGNQKDYQHLFELALSVKKALKPKTSIRLVTSRESILSSVIVTKNNLLNKELLFLKTADNWQIAVTVAVQDFDDYGQRDVLRPERDAKSGMLPPKLAQMMLNLASTDKNLTLLDPFCGSGTILQEAMLLGFKNIYGTDISQKAIADSQANIDWLKNKSTLANKVNLKLSDVQNLAIIFNSPRGEAGNKEIDLIVTEPFMGDAKILSQHISSRTAGGNQVNDIILDLKKLYYQAFLSFAKICSTKARIVFIFPAINFQNQTIATLDKKAITSTGWQQLHSPLGELIYQRPGQIVSRNITLWQRT